MLVQLEVVDINFTFLRVHQSGVFSNYVTKQKHK